MKVVCIDNHAYIAIDPDGTVRAPRADESLSVSLTVGNVYDVIAEEGSMYRLIDNTGDDYLFPKEMFRVV